MYTLIWRSVYLNIIHTRSNPQTTKKKICDTRIPRRTPLPITWNPLGCLPGSLVRCFLGQISIGKQLGISIYRQTTRINDHKVILLMLQKTGYNKTLGNNGINYIPQLVNTGFLIIATRNPSSFIIRKAWPILLIPEIRLSS